MDGRPYTNGKANSPRSNLRESLPGDRLGRPSLMRSRFKQLFNFALMAVVLLGISSCGKNGSGTATITSVVISPTTATVALNTQTEFTAVVNLSATTTSSGTTISTSTAVTWEVNGTAGGSSTLGTIVPSTTDAQVGGYTAPNVVPTTNNGQ